MTARTQAQRNAERAEYDAKDGGGCCDAGTAVLRALDDADALLAEIERLKGRIDRAVGALTWSSMERPAIDRALAILSAPTEGEGE